MSRSIAILGDEALVSAWTLLGFEVLAVTDEADLKSSWEKVLTSDYKIIYILEKWAKRLKPQILSLSEKPFPVIVVIPESVGATAFSEELLKQISLRAVGTDIIKVVER
jgi:vacuolar-type H+-ATPase subunit F/Vma7